MVRFEFSTNGYTNYKQVYDRLMTLAGQEPFLRNSRSNVYEASYDTSDRGAYQALKLFLAMQNNKLVQSPVAVSFLYPDETTREKRSKTHRHTPTSSSESHGVV